jgi:hypothetical protein
VAVYERVFIPHDMAETVNGILDTVQHACEAKIVALEQSSTFSGFSSKTQPSVSADGRSPDPVLRDGAALSAAVWTAPEWKHQEDSITDLRLSG